MQPLKRTLFFDGYRTAWGALHQSQVDGLNSILDSLEQDAEVSDVRWAAYILATIKHECANVWHPIEEYGKGKGHRYGQPDPITHQTYYGRGYVQLTWKDNYQKFADLLGVDLVYHPELALDRTTAWAICSLGMRRGLFTGKSLDDYINDQGTDYLHARKIINAMDKADLLAAYARQFERIITAAL